jgi:hypothetical protein
MPPAPAYFCAVARTGAGMVIIDTARVNRAARGLDGVTLMQVKLVLLSHNRAIELRVCAGLSGICCGLFSQIKGPEAFIEQNSPLPHHMETCCELACHSLRTSCMMLIAM